MIHAQGWRSSLAWHSSLFSLQSSLHVLIAIRDSFCSSRATILSSFSPSISTSSSHQKTRKYQKNRPNYILITILHISHHGSQCIGPVRRKTHIEIIGSLRPSSIGTAYTVELNWQLLSSSSQTFDQYKTNQKVKHRKAASDTADLSDICQIFGTSLDRLQNQSLQSQRFVVSQQKTQHLSFLALGARIERALNRRLVKQDANPPRRRKTESGVHRNTSNTEEVASWSWDDLDCMEIVLLCQSPSTVVSTGEGVFVFDFFVCDFSIHHSAAIPYHDNRQKETPSRPGPTKAESSPTTAYLFVHQPQPTGLVISQTPSSPCFEIFNGFFCFTMTV